MSARLPTTFYMLYKRLLSPILHSVTGTAGACRFQPTCSEYAVLAVGTHGWLVGSWFACMRVLRCNPMCRGGFDPVPGTWHTSSAPAIQEKTDSCRVSPRRLP